MRIIDLLQRVNPRVTGYNRRIVRAVAYMLNNNDLVKDKKLSEYNRCLYKVGICKEVMEYIRFDPSLIDNPRITTATANTEVTLDAPTAEKAIRCTNFISSKQPDANLEMGKLLAQMLVKFAAFRYRTSEAAFKKRISVELVRMTLIF